MITPYPITNFEIEKYYLNELKLKGAHSRNNLLKIKDEAYVINLDKWKLINTYWIVLYVNDDNVTCFDRFGEEYVLKEIKNFIGNKNITTNI